METQQYANEGPHLPFLLGGVLARWFGRLAILANKVDSAWIDDWLAIRTTAAILNV